MNLEWLYSNLTWIIIVLIVTTVVLFISCYFIRADLLKKKKEKIMDTLYIGLVMALIFLVVAISQVFTFTKR